VAAEAYALLRGRRALTTVLVGPSHRIAFDGVSVYAAGAFETPLGLCRVAEDVADEIVRAHPSFSADPWPHREEHSLEMQLPFLQHVVRDLRIVPALMGTQDRSEVDMLAAALGGVIEGDDTILIASSDLSHYHPAAEANALDARVVEHVARFDPEGLMDRLESYRGHACGGGALDDAPQVPPVDQLHHQEVAAAAEAEVQHLHDVAVREAHRDVSLVDEHVAELGVRVDGAVNPLEDDGLLETVPSHLRRQEDLGHAAVRDPANDVVSAVLRHPRGWNFTTLHWTLDLGPLVRGRTTVSRLISGVP
jgi:AmmeMemoRadiSam system protein B